MTLQQKLLAKKSKKGFTLVELVVVIAILAILAAIAIPMVVNIINSATQSSGESSAATLSQNAKSLYASIKSGAVNNDDSKNSDGSDVDFAAAKNATAKAKTDAAKAADISDVMTYAGLNINLGQDYWFCATTTANNGVAVGDIRFTDDGEQPDSPAGCTWSQLETSSTLGEIYKET